VVLDSLPRGAGVDSAGLKKLSRLISLRKYFGDDPVGRKSPRKMEGGEEGVGRGVLRTELDLTICLSERGVVPFPKRPMFGVEIDNFHRRKTGQL